MKTWREILFNEAGSRRLPSVDEFDSRRQFWSISDMLFAACEAGPTSIYVIPTVEWIERVARWLASVGARSVLEVGAGDGFVTEALQRAVPAGLIVRACDDASWGGSHIRRPAFVERLSAIDAVDAYRPDVVLWCWPPLGSTAMLELVRRPSVRYYVEVGERPGGCTGSVEELVERFRHASSNEIGTHARGRTDDGTWLNSHVVVVYGAAHEDHAEWEVSADGMDYTRVRISRGRETDAERAEREERMAER